MHIKIPNIFTFISDFKKEQILTLNKNVGVILRNYEKTPDKDKILEIKQFCKFHKRQFYLANDFEMAKNLNLDGVYIPSFNKKLNFKKCPIKNNFLILGSAHNIKEIKIKELQKVDLIFLSPLFKTKNYSKGLGIVRFNILSNYTTRKVIALGGINKNNLNKLKITNAHGYSGISYFKNG